jgi:hypothetical protein
LTRLHYFPSYRIRKVKKWADGGQTYKEEDMPIYKWTLGKPTSGGENGYDSNIIFGFGFLCESSVGHNLPIKMNFPFWVLPLLTEEHGKIKN